MLRVLGIDPGLQITGYAVVEGSARSPKVCEAGVIRSDAVRAGSGASEGTAKRICSLYEGIVEVMEQFAPEVMALEQLYAHYQHPRTAILMAHARGVILLAAAQRQVPVVSYNATHIKKTITGNGHAAKDQVQRTIQRELGLKTLPAPPDVADALATALCHYYLAKR